MTGLTLAVSEAAADLTFAPPTVIETLGGTSDIILNDLDGDGDLDIISLETLFDFPGSLLGLVHVIRNNVGAFGAVQTLELGSSPALENAFHHVRAGDIDGDGDVDLAYIGSTTPLSFLLANGDGSFAAPIDSGFSVQLGPVAGLLDLGDLDGDGDLDGVIAMPADLLLNEGGASFNAVDLIDDFNGTNLRILDLDADGDLDIAHGFRVHLNDGTGAFTISDTFPGSGSAECAFADFDGDGAIDVACQRRFSTTEIRFALGNGDGTFSTQPAIPVEGVPGDIEAADFDGDGHTDLVVTLSGPCCDPTDFVDIFRGLGDGTFGAAQRIEVPSEALLAVGDLDGDDRPDLVLATGGQFDDADSIATALNRSGIVRPADLDGDGMVGVSDLLILLGAWGVCAGDCPPACTGDLDADCTIGVNDLLALLADWG